MSVSTEIWNLSALCRCCHTYGNYLSLGQSYVYGVETEVYSNMLHDTFNVKITMPLLNASYTICEDCIIKLRDASQFKKQVILCEEKFEEYCKNEVSIAINDNIIKIEMDDNDYNYDNNKIEVEVEPIVDDNKKEILQNGDKRVINEINKVDTIKSIVLRNKKKGTREKRTSTAKEMKVKYDFSQEVFVKTDSGVIYSCKTCGGTYDARKLIKKHIMTNHLLGDPYRCDVCKKTSIDKASLLRHKKTHDRNFKCQFCPRTFASTYLLKEHINSHTKSNIYKCDKCLKEFLYKSSLRKHVKIHYGTKKNCICYICGHPFNDSTNMLIHIRVVHEKLRPYICDMCQKSFPAKKHLVVHIRKHMGYMPFKCDSCKKKFYTLFEKNIHRCLSSLEDKTYTCKICAKTFNFRNVLTKHIKRSHSGEKPYKCSVCPKDFISKYTRDRHERSHTGLKPFKCELCQKKYTQKCLLDRHIILKHGGTSKTKKKQTECPICKIYVVDLKRHNTSCHVSKKVVCEYCNMTFSQNNALNRHKRTVHVGLKYKCRYCNSMYVQKYKLSKHMSKVHGIEEKDVDLGDILITNGNQDIENV